MIRHALVGSLSAFLFVFVILAAFLRIAQIKAHNSSNVFSACQKSNTFSPSTGDLLMMQYADSGMRAYPRGFRDIPTHCGMIWVREGKVCVIEATRFGGTHPLRDVMWNKSEGNGVRVVLLQDLLSSADVYCSIRPLASGIIDAHQLHYEMETWAKHLQFEDAISSTMQPIDILAIGFGPVFPSIGSFFANLSGLSSPKRKQVFCSEFISILLQRLGHIPHTFSKHWSVAPLSLTSKVKFIDTLSAEALVPLSWKEEILLVCQ
jgi:hypothetical protein